MKALLQLLEQGTSGVLVHCISGWDRTPLFISLLRLSLWADGAIHRSLPASDILYLTLAYDWYLFGHGLPDRLSKGQEILYFCFKMLHHISGDEFSVSSESDQPSQQQGSPHTQNSPHSRQQHSPPHNGMTGLRHQGSNISLTSNNSGGSDGMPFVLDTTQDEDSISPLDWDVGPSPQRSRHTSGSSTDEHHGRRNSGGRGSVGVESPLRYDSPPDRHRHLSHSSTCSGQRGQSPEVGYTGDTHSHRHCRAGLTEHPLMEGGMTNHFSSSPVNVPARQSPQSDHAQSFTATPSLGSWVDVGFPQMTPPYMITPPRHPPDFDHQNSVHSCQEASDLNNMTSRRRRLNAIAQMFEDAYLKAALSKPSGGQGALSSLIGNVAEKMGFRSGPR
ncbi:hypothetical protein V1264_020537 [Littorina saxatilis]|uniref:Tyrosine specific protein phosphatases domain-containing protein n=2 Tax=Littorina saxatilis TaxID=31220 RepID=A0AAN9BBT5_9CAEN